MGRRASNGGYKLLTTILYAGADWVIRHPDGWITVNVAGARLAAGWQRAKVVRSAAQSLLELGIFTDLQWHGHYFIARVRNGS